MIYCNNKKLKTENIYKMSELELNHTLDGCELYCDKYYQCQTVALMNDELMKKENESEK